MMRIAGSTKTALKITALSAVLGVGGLTLGGLTMPGDGDGAAWAQGQGQGGQGQGQGGGGQGGGGHGGGGGGQGQGQAQGGQGQGQGGQGQGQGGGGGGKPVWAQEGIPAVELGRLSVARSPDHVLERALAEALSTWTPEMEAFYGLSLDEMITELSLNWDNVTIYDSPLQNLALLKDVLADDATQLPVGTSTGTLAAVFLGVASDKTVPISTDTVIAVTTILGYPVTDTSAADLAAAAEAIRIAVLAGHG